MLKIALITFAVLAIVILWFILDTYYGRKALRKANEAVWYPKRAGNATVIADGHHLNESLWADIEASDSLILVSFFIIRNDPVTHDFCELLIKKAREGVAVFILVDRLGSFEVTRKMRERFEANGVHFHFSNLIHWKHPFYTLNHRNHRKIIVTDDKVGYVGGFNIGEEYLGKNTVLGPWRDYHLRITGDGVQDLRTQFQTDWARVSSVTVPSIPLTEDNPIVYASYPVAYRFLATNGWGLEEHLLRFIGKAKRKIWIVTPYFVPSRSVMSKLLDCLQAGVKLYIIVPQRGDHPFVLQTAIPFLKPLVEHGAHVYLYRDGFFHGKVIAIDEEWVDLGSANFDYRSLFINDELNCVIRDHAFTQFMISHFESDTLKSNPIDREFFKRLSFGTRVKIWIGILFRPLF
ncbi:MAG: phospholipase D-like domain-containing protein [Bacilli bacterium]